jgi:two-component sensor histidine kinase
VFGDIQDITERKRVEERQRLLMAELDHRVRNTLAVVQALAQQSLTGGPDDSAVFTGRLAALARTHTLLAENRWAGADLKAVVESTLSP